MERVLEAVTLLGVNPPPPRPTPIGTLLILVALVVALVVGWWYWREAHEEEASDSPEELLASFEEAHAAGEIDDEELQRLRDRLAPSSGRRPQPPPKGESSLD
jgi:hypothetical protein